MKRTFKYYDGSPVMLKKDLIVKANELTEVEEDDNELLSYLTNNPRFEEVIAERVEPVKEVVTENSKPDTETLSTKSNKNNYKKKVKQTMEEK